jgi:hypothetical protein
MMATSVLVAACASDVPTAPVIDVPGTATPASITARSTAFLVGAPGVEVTESPTVMVRNRAGAAMTGVLVTFTVTQGGGAVAHAAVSTDDMGMARTAWRLGDTQATNVLTATVASAGAGAVTFFARVGPGGVARYDLQTVGGLSLPRDYSGGGTSWSIVGGHYLLFDDGIYAFCYVSTAAPGAPRDSILTGGSYTTESATTLRFYLAPGSYPRSTFYQQLGGLFATGTVGGDRMSMKYTDWLDFEDEVYVSAR